MPEEKTKIIEIDKNIENSVVISKYLLITQLKEAKEKLNKKNIKAEM